MYNSNPPIHASQQSRLAAHWYRLCTIRRRGLVTRTRISQRGATDGVKLKRRGLASCPTRGSDYEYNGC